MFCTVFWGSSFLLSGHVTSTPQVQWKVACSGSIGSSCLSCNQLVLVVHHYEELVSVATESVPGSSIIGEGFFRLECLGLILYLFSSFPLPGLMCLRTTFLGNLWLTVFPLSYFSPATGKADFFYIWADGILLLKMKCV